jgi:hypothetical protein
LAPDGFIATLIYSNYMMGRESKTRFIDEDTEKNAVS